MDHLTNHIMGQSDELEQLILKYMDALHTGQPVDRQAFLSAHAEYRRELEAFIQEYDRIESLAAPLRDSVHSGPALDLAVRNSKGGMQFNESTQLPSIGQLGEFRLLREIGRGGMGVVYEAEQLSLIRRVALKVLPFASAIDERRLQRFKNEALAAAHLRHANIVPVFAVGTDRGVHYYAMQFIEGQSLAALISELQLRQNDSSMLVEPEDGCQALEETSRAVQHSATCAMDKPSGANSVAMSISHDLSSGSRKYFDWVAAIGRQAAEALEYAHQMGIVHRDIKPANLLLDPKGQLWITDFGLAQVNGDAGLTVTGELLGTLRYVSPEQALARSGVVDHRTDIYSLGATMYELLALQPVFDGRDRNELIREIADEVPRLLSSIRPSIPKDLETVILKSLAKDPSERYSTAQEMAADLQRYLENRPILAKRPTKVEHFRKWVRRHPLVVAACATALLLAFTGSSVSAVLIHIEQRKAEQAFKRERLRADEAELQFRLAKRSVDELFRLSEEELAYNPAAESLRRRILTSVVSYYKEFIHLRRDNPGSQKELRETRERVEKILADLAILRAARQFSLLGQPAVIDELSLDPEQQSKLEKLAARSRAQWMDVLRAVGHESAAERERRTLEQARAADADLRAILSEKQVKRLHELGLQADVAEAFRDPDVAAALTLTDQQKDAIRTIEEGFFVEVLKSFRPDLVPADSRSTAPMVPKNQRLLEVLNESQRQKWREITGIPLRELVQAPLPFDLGPPASAPSSPPSPTN